MTRLSNAESRALRHQLHDEIDAGGMSYSAAIRRMRATTGLTQAEFAAALGFTERQIAELETGKSNPTVKTLERLGRHYGVVVGFVRKPKPKR